MRAWVQDSYGVLPHQEEIPEPVAGENQVVIDVHAASVNNGDTRVMQGEPLLIRPFFGWRRPRQRTRGVDVAGVVSVAGGRFSVGDRVACEVSGGGFAQHVVAPFSRLAIVPEEVSFTRAASVVVAGGTAWAALHAARVGEASSGKKVLVLGASGGVGSFAIALAALRGATVTAVCRASAMEHVRACGAVDVRARDGADAAVGADERFDAIIDIAGDRSLRQLRGMLAPGAVAALVTGNGSRLLGPIPRIIGSVFLSRKSRALVPVAQKPSATVLTALLALAQSGDLPDVVTRHWGFAEVPAALTAVLHGEVLGKSVVEVRGR